MGVRTPPSIIKTSGLCRFHVKRHDYFSGCYIENRIIEKYQNLLTNKLYYFYLFLFTFCVQFCLFMGYFSGIGQYFITVKFQKTVRSSRPVCEPKVRAYSSGFFVLPVIRHNPDKVKQYVPDRTFPFRKDNSWRWIHQLLRFFHPELFPM